MFISPCLPTVGVYDNCCIYNGIQIHTSTVIMCVLVQCVEIGSFYLFLGLLNQREVSFPC